MTEDEILYFRRNQYLYAFEPRGRSFWVWPKVLKYWQVKLEWDGIKTSFADSDDEQFGIAEARAVAFYIRSIVHRSMDPASTPANTFMQLYLTERRKLWIEGEDKKNTYL
jgi:hypothetical protein